MLWLLYTYITSLDFSKVLAILIFLISSKKQELKILKFFNISKIKTTLKTLFLNKPFISFYLNFINNICIRRSKKSFSYKKVETSTLFWYLIDGYYTWKSLVIGVKKVLVVDKSVISDNKF